MERNNSPEDPDWRETNDIPGLPSGVPVIMRVPKDGAGRGEGGCVCVNC